MTADADTICISNGITSTIRSVCMDCMMTMNPKIDKTTRVLKRRKTISDCVDMVIDTTMKSM